MIVCLPCVTSGENTANGICDIDSTSMSTARVSQVLNVLQLVRYDDEST
jgi:hypothetical protein